MDLKELDQRMTALSTPARRAIAMRAALRGLPALSKCTIGGDVIRAPLSSLEPLYLELIAPLCISGVAAVEPTAEHEGVAADAAGSAEVASSCAVFFASVNQNLSECGAVHADTATAVADAAAAAALADPACAVQEVRNAYLENSIYYERQRYPCEECYAEGANKKAAVAADTAVATDLIFVESKHQDSASSSSEANEFSALGLIDTPLWRKAGLFAEVSAFSDRLKDDLRGVDAGFEIWIDWYEARLRGDPWDQELMVKWVQVLTKRHSEARVAEINAELALITAEHRKRAQDRL